MSEEDSSPGSGLKIFAMGAFIGAGNWPASSMKGFSPRQPMSRQPARSIEPIRDVGGVVIEKSTSRAA